MTVQKEGIPHVFSFRCRSKEIRPAPGFGKAFGCKNIAAQERPDIFFFLCIGAVQDDGVTDQFRADTEDTGKLIAEGSDLLHQHAGGHPVHLPAAPFFGVTAAQEVAFSRLLEKLLGKLDFVCVHIEDHLPRDPFDQVAGLVSDLQLFVGEHVIKHFKLLPV